MRIAVFNSFDITPAQNGGEIRLLNIYSHLSRKDSVRFVSYDLRCKVPVRRERLGPAFDIVDTMVTDSDRWDFYQVEERLGLHPHDVLCIDTYAFSPQYLREVDDALKWAEAIVVSHPYLAPQIFSRCSPLHLRIFEAHNVEIKAKTSYFKAARDRPIADSLLRAVRRSEAYALENADIVLTVSEADTQGFIEEYGVSPAKLHVVPNGVTVAAYDGVSAEVREAFRAEAGLTNSDVGVFLGSGYGPNVDAYKRARAWLDEAGFDGTIFVVGKVADAYNENWPVVCFTEKWLGFVEDATKRLLVKSADFSIQIVTSGGGTNLKLFDYMAAGTPIIANTFGRRGVADGGWFIPVETAEDMHSIVKDRSWRTPAAKKAALAAHRIALRDFDWASIAERYRAVLA